MCFVLFFFSNHILAKKKIVFILVIETHRLFKHPKAKWLEQLDIVKLFGLSTIVNSFHSSKKISTTIGSFYYLSHLPWAGPSPVNGTLPASSNSLPSRWYLPTLLDPPIIHVSSYVICFVHLQWVFAQSTLQITTLWDHLVPLS